MKILLLCGFLGSGKTTLLLKLIPLLRDNYAKIAILENEIGETGVDGDFLKGQDLKVRELTGGCICCTFQSDMLAALEELHDRFAPDLVIMEATGAAKPSNVLTPLTRLPDLVTSLATLGVVDAPRYEMLDQMLGALMQDIFASSDAIAVTKTEDTDPALVARIKDRAEKTVSTSTAVPLAREDSGAVENLIGNLIPCLT